jgi:hypothetical protein
MRVESKGQLENLRLVINKGCEDASPLLSLLRGRVVK